MMTVLSVIDRVKIMLGITDDSRDELLAEIARLVAMPVLLHIKQNEVPGELEWIVVELAVARYNKIGAEGYTEEKSDNIQNKYEENTFNKYVPFLNEWIERNSEPTTEPKVRFF